MNWLIEKVKNFNKRIAIIQDGDQHTYSDLHGEILRSKNLLRQHKVYESQVVSVLSDYSLQSIALIIALQENKNIIVPITSITNDEIKYRIVESNSDKCIQIKDNEYVVEEFNTTTKHIMIKNLIDK